MEASESIEALASALKTDRTIKIYVEGDETPYLVSQQALCSASIYFVKAIKNEHMGENNVGVLRFPEDRSRAWKVLLFWITQKTLPAIEGFPNYKKGTKTVAESMLVDSWILADKYLMPKLQNAIMKILLASLDENSICFETGVRALREHTTSSVLGRLLCESLVEVTHKGKEGGLKPGALNRLDGITGAIVAIGAAVESFTKTSRNMKGVREWPHRMKSEVWKEFMVAE